MAPSRGVHRIERRRPAAAGESGRAPGTSDATLDATAPVERSQPDTPVMETAAGQTPATGSTHAPATGTGRPVSHHGHAVGEGAGRAGNGSATGRRASKILVGTEGERTIHRGSLQGDRAVRIRRPRLSGFRAIEPGIIRLEAEDRPKSGAQRAWRGLKRTLIGAPIRSEHEGHERLDKLKGLAAFGTDNISSSAYATEELMRVLMMAGTAALVLTVPLTLGVIALLAIVVISYQQTIKAYPKGGGSYIVSSENLGVVPGLVAGASILVDYVLTVAVSVSAGVAALTSAFPTLHDNRVPIAVLGVAFIMWGNLRGIRESGTLFAAPAYLYLVGMFGLLAYGAFRFAVGSVPEYVPLPEDPAHAHAVGTQALTLFLILRAFASGAVGLTGTEAVADGVSAFKPPESRNARTVLIAMALCFGTIFFGISLLASWIGIVPDPSEVETVNSQVTRALVGLGPYYYVMQFGTSLLLVLAANTAFADFPRLASFMSRDKFLPSHFSFRGERLAFNNGIVILAVMAAVLIVVFQGSVTNLIPLYTVGVFIAFTLSQAGLVMRWWRLREAGWQWRMSINATGAVVTAIVALVVAVTKFALGAWVVLVLIPALVMVLLAIRKHYDEARDQLVVTDEDLQSRPDLDPHQLQHIVVIPVADLNRASLRAVAYARSLTGQVDRPDDEGNTHIVAVHVTDDPENGERIKEKWDRSGTHVDFVVLESPYRALVGPLLQYINALEKQQLELTSIVTVLLPEYIPAHWWEHVLHTQTALHIKGALLFRPRTAVASVPYHLHD